jgi:DHA2 family multidrug resistance protein
VANAITLPATNWLGNLIGRKRFFITCICLLTIASALCGAAGSLGFLVVARVLQGAGGGALQPISQAVLLESFPPQKRGSDMAVFALGVIVAPIAGPTLGGWITDNYSWRWIFYINLPIGMLAAWLAHSFVEDPPYLRKVHLKDIDYIGFGFLAIWLATLQYILDRGQELDWFSSRVIVWLAVISSSALIAFVVRELTADRPIVDLRILKNRNFAVGVGLMAFLGALLYGTTALLPLFMQELLNYTALDAGLAMSPRGVAAFIATVFVGRLVGKVSARLLITIGFLVLSYSSFMLGHIDLEMGIKNVIVPSIVNGIAISFIFVPLTTATMGTLRQQQMGNATGIFNLMRNLGGSIGIAMVTTYLGRRSQHNQNVLVGHLSVLNPIFRQHFAQIQASLAMHAGAWQATRQAYGVVYGTLQQQSLLLAYVYNFRLFGLTCLLTTPLVFLFKKVAATKARVDVH